MTVTTESPNRTAYLLLACALAISVVLAFPIEQFAHAFSSPGSYWIVHSCEDLTADLSLGSILQAILTPIFVFFLPGPGSIFRQKSVPSSSLRPSLARTTARRIPAVSQNSDRGRRSIIAVAVVLLFLCLAVFVGTGWVLKHWIGDTFGAQPLLAGSSFANVTVLALLFARLTFSLLGIGAAIYLLRTHVSWEPWLFFAAGCSCAGGVAVAWWYALRQYAALHGVCPDLFDLSRPTDFHVDYLSDCARYFIYLSVFSAFWVGITAGALRLQSARIAIGESARNELHQFHSFYWLCFLGWAVQYRLSQWFARSSSHHQEWPMLALLDFLFLTVSSLWTLAFIPSLWRKKPRRWIHAVVQAYWRSFVILFLTLLTFFWLVWLAGAALKPLVTLNAFGLAWALTVGTWRWRALQKQQLASIARKV
jgi:hypothetical protein